MNIIETFEISGYPQINVNTGKVAKKADGSVVVSMNKTTILSTVVVGKKCVNADFLPLRVDYQERFSAIGEIALYRETKLNEREILISRCIDRILRPTIDNNFRYEIQVDLTLFSANYNILPEPLACLGASLSMLLTNVPFYKPVALVYVLKVGDDYVVTYDNSNYKTSDVKLIIGGNEDNIVSIEGECENISNDTLISILNTAHDHIKQLCAFQKEFAQKVKDSGNCKSLSYTDNGKKDCNCEFFDTIKNKLIDNFSQIIKEQGISTEQKKEKLQNCKSNILEQYKENISCVNSYYNFVKDLEKQVLRDTFLETGIRFDGRKADEIRSIDCEINVLPVPHGSALFTRGNTQVLSSVIIGSKMSRPVSNNVLNKVSNKLTVNYNFPSFAIGETCTHKKISRREFGHGNIVKKSLKNVISSDYTMHHTIQIVNDVLESDGSTSMASVCAGSLALMDAGVNVSKAIAGVAMGMISTNTMSDHRILTDITGCEDFIGDFDFKVVGSKDGIYSLQFDTKKQEGISIEIISEALTKAQEARLFILDKMNATIASYRIGPKNSNFDKTITIDRNLIGTIIGVKGNVIQNIQKVTKTVINIDDVDGKGYVRIFGSDEQSVHVAEDMILKLIEEPKIGCVYEGLVINVFDYGVFIEFMPNKIGLLHKTEMNNQSFNGNSILIEQGDRIKVKLIDLPSKNKYTLSNKDIDENYQINNDNQDIDKNIIDEDDLLNNI